MIVNFGTLVQTNDVSECFFHFSKILSYWAKIMGKKGKKCPEVSKNLFTFYLRNQTSDMIKIFGILLQSNNISKICFQFWKILFFGGKNGAKNATVLQIKILLLCG